EGSRSEQPLRQSPAALALSARMSPSFASGQIHSSTATPSKGLGWVDDASNSQINRATLQMGLPATIHGTFSGTAQAFQESLANEPVLILAALATVYIVLGVLYSTGAVALPYRPQRHRAGL